MDESIVERIITIMEYYGLSSSAFADKVDVQRSSMSHLVSGRNKPSLDFIQKILNQFSDINPTWLIMGTGPMKQLALFDDSGEPAVPIPLPIQKAVATPIVQPVQQEFVPSYEQISASVRENVVPERPVLVEPVSKPAPVQEIISPEIPPVPPSYQPTSTPNSDISKEKSVSNDKKVTKIVFFYSDNTFETFNPH